jgi:hypothetical protein
VIAGLALAVVMIVVTPRLSHGSEAAAAPSLR